MSVGQSGASDPLKQIKERTDLRNLSREELEAKIAAADAMYRAQGRSLEDCRELLADAKRDGDGWCERASKAEAAAAFWEHEYEAAQEHVLEASERQSPEPLEPTFMRDGSEPCEVCGCDRTAELVRREDGAVIHIYCTNVDCERSKHL